MSNKRTSYTPEFKARIALLALWESMTLWEISSKYEVHATQIGKWKKELQEHGSSIFTRTSKKNTKLLNKEQELEKAYKQIWRLTVENDWLKKNIAKLPYNLKQPILEYWNTNLSLCRQAKLLNISRSFLYKEKRTTTKDEQLMVEIDKIYIKYPFYGARRIKVELHKLWHTEITRYQVR